MNFFEGFIQQVFGPTGEIQLAVQDYRTDTSAEDADTVSSKKLVSYFDSRAVDLTSDYPGLTGAVEAVRSFVADDELVRWPRIRAAAGLVALGFLEQSERFGNISESLR